MEVLIKQVGQEERAVIYQELSALLFKDIQDTFERDPMGSDASGKEYLEDSKKPSTVKKGPDGQHDTEGWKSLETSMRILQKLIEALGKQFLDFDYTQVIEILLKSANHLNRFVREITYFVIKALYDISLVCGDQEDIFIGLCEKLIPITANGLADNWSQVRFAASTATRSFYTFAKEKEQLRTGFDHLMLPRMCLNRYYVAEGVRNYSIETWRLLVDNHGIELVQKYAKEFCDFYISQAQADNHAVREAACHCISELCQKCEKDPFRPYIEDLLACLIDCFKDESWPVRDSACISCGSFVKAYPKESKVRLGELHDLWFAHLSDNINSVREHSAAAICDCLSVFETETWEKIKTELDSNLLKAREQKEDSKKFANYEASSTFGVSKMVHEDQQMYSCGSLAPKLKRGGGCMDHGFT